MWKVVLILLVAVALPATQAGDGKKKKKGANDACECLDISFVLDTSGSISDSEWGLLLDFVCTFIGTFQFPPDDIRFAAVMFSADAKVEFDFSNPCNTATDGSNNFQACKAIIQAIDRPRDLTNHRDALQKLLDGVLGGPGDRDNQQCPNVVILISDGDTTTGGDPSDVAALVRNVATVLAVAIGDFQVRSTLEDITGDPNLVLTASDFNALIGLVNDLRTLTCDSNDFNPACQTCCCGDIFGDHHKPIPDRKNKCCGKQRYNPRKTHAVCCQGYLFVGYDDRWTRCCYDQPYDIRLYTCCYNKIVPATRTQDQCCGNIAFNQKHEICCYGNVYKKNKHTQCCYNVAFNPQWEICCRYVVSEGCSYNYRCCGTRAYNPIHEVCTRPYLSSVEDSPLKYCGQDIELPCGDGVYDPKWHICCHGTRYDGGVTRKDGCCRELRYNTRTQLCCDGNLIDADPAWYHCCGRQAFDPWTHTCCHGYFLAEGVGQCCGYYRVFNHKHEICCGGYYVFKGRPHRTKCCYSYYFGYRPYDTKKELCCYGYVQRGGRHWYCCGYYSYNIKTHMCCYGRIYPRKVFRLMGFCDSLREGIPSADPSADLAADAASDAEPPSGNPAPPPEITDDDNE